MAEPSKVPKAKAIAALRDLAHELEALKGGMHVEDPKFKRWRESVRSTFRHVFGGTSDELATFEVINFSSPYLGNPPSDDWDYGSPAPHGEGAYFQSGLQEAHNLIEVYSKKIEDFWPDEQTNMIAQPRAVDLVIKIVDRFHVAVRRLRTRRESRPPLAMGDEYDVQYLFGAFLDIHFDDIEPEECTPSYAGGAARIDFVLRRERVAIEAKRTRPTLTAKKVGEELLVDIARYEKHPGVDTLICFVYDPDSIIVNPRGLEHDLESTPSGRLNVRALIRPQ